MNADIFICENHLNLRDPRSNFPNLHQRKTLQIGVNHFQRWRVGSLGLLGADTLDGPEDLGEFVDCFDECNTGFAVGSLAGFGTQLHDFVN